ncbi:MAG: carbamoyltransferase C-terminal domain-containing protein, partial [Planctomycetota bacterium]
AHGADGIPGAVWVAHRSGAIIRPMRHAYLGPSFDDTAVKSTLERFHIPNRHFSDAGIVDRVAGLLARGEVVAWFQGRMEYGPRALGNRSILGNPLAAGTADRINGEIKFREKWRPFCPSIAGEEAQQILDSSHPSPFMALSFIVNPTWREKLPEAVHVDGSARPQIVTKDLNPRFHALIRAFCQHTGVPVVLNTSLNRRGEPIVCTPEDALRTFYGSGLRFLAIGDRLVAKNPKQLEEEL